MIKCVMCIHQFNFFFSSDKEYMLNNLIRQKELKLKNKK